MNHLKSYLKQITSEETLSAAMAALSEDTGRSTDAIQVAAHRGRLPGHWYPDIVKFALARGFPMPPEDLFNLRRQRSSETAE
ncbi:hypothetical protein [Oceanicella sp. SM1341]|uniref:hypothetical protein n=1 Tax=Oceanicella sp. SM1341 TaxID=1548889 RepID=UPI000E4A56AF|nr:hypothetical protein [Oceanicella sp. SM1341]